jgi:hypothetical protein
MIQVTGSEFTGTAIVVIFCTIFQTTEQHVLTAVSFDYKLFSSSCEKSLQMWLNMLLGILLFSD